jgi:hypothetical protein
LNDPATVDSLTQFEKEYSNTAQDTSPFNKQLFGEKPAPPGGRPHLSAPHPLRHPVKTVTANLSVKIDCFHATIS